jgi:hypothetical protein
VSIKDRWIDLCEQVLNVSIACRRYEPGKPSSRSSIEGWLCSHCFNSCLGRKIGYRPVDRSAVVLWIGSGALFREQWPCLTLLTTTWMVTIRWSRKIRMVWDHTQTEREMRVVCWLGFPYRVYINLNHRDSRIWVTTCSWQSSRS